MRLGFTGTQKGMTRLQRITLEKYLVDNGGEFHHGDCIGADGEAHDLAVYYAWSPIIHPPSNPEKRAFKKSGRIGHPMPYLDRNRIIVSETDALIATPGEYKEQLRSGTWSTIRYARKLKRKIIIIFPDGSVKEENV